jgi:hypothetical protein
MQGNAELVQELGILKCRLAVGSQVLVVQTAMEKALNML